MGFVHDSYNCLKQLAFVCICWNKPLLSCFVLGNYSANVQFLSSSIMISFCMFLVQDILNVHLLSLL